MHRFVQRIKLHYRHIRRSLRRWYYDKLKVIIFDVDGVLRDSIPAIYLATCDTLLHFGVTHERLPTYEEFCAHYEEPWQEFYRSHGVSTEDEAELKRVYMQYWHARRHLPKFFEEVVEVVRELHQLGLRLAVVSMNATDYLEVLLTDEKVRGYFDFIIGGVEDKGAGMREVCRLARVAPEEVAYVGDLRSDMAFADREGLHRWARHYPDVELPDTACIRQCEVDFRVIGTLHSIVHEAARRVKKR